MIPKPAHLLLGGATLLSVMLAGCASTDKPACTVDRTLVRQSDAGREAFAEGNLGEAVKRYDRALLRAWATDDPYESGSVAYNLAACLVSQGKLDEAAGWLTDARVELTRGNASTGNAWLLSSEIAMAQNRFEDATRLVDYAARSCPPCEVEPTQCLCGPGACCREECPESKACDECCLVKLPCCGKKIRERQQTEDCHQAYQARIELARARLAAKQFDLVCAKRHLAIACELSMEVCDPLLHADRHDVAALIHDQEEHWLAAGAHRDREVELLRCIGHYRQIPDILDAAADAYHAAGRMDLAVDRMIRSARVWLGRGDTDRAWQRVRRGGELSQGSGCQSVEIRLSLTAKKIEQQIDRVSDASLSLDMPPPPNTLPPSEISSPSDISLPSDFSMPNDPFAIDVMTAPNDGALPQEDSAALDIPALLQISPPMVSR